MTVTADLMKLVEELRESITDWGDNMRNEVMADLLKQTDRIAAALSSTGEAQYPEDSDVSVSEDGTLHVDLCRDGSPKRQLSILVQKDGAVKFAVYCEGRRYHGSVNDPDFIAALADYSSTGEARVGGEVGFGKLAECPPEMEKPPMTDEERAALTKKFTAKLLAADAAIATHAQPKAQPTFVAFKDEHGHGVREVPAHPKASEGKAGGEVPPEDMTGDEFARGWNQCREVMLAATADTSTEAVVQAAAAVIMAELSNEMALPKYLGMTFRSALLEAAHTIYRRATLATPAQPKASTYDDFVRLAKDPNRPKASEACSHHFVRDDDAPLHHCCQKCGAVKHDDHPKASEGKAGGEDAK